jgi:hypothetical protein
MYGTPPPLSHIPSCFAWAQLLFTYDSVMSVLQPKGWCQHLSFWTLFFKFDIQRTVKRDIFL